MHFAAMAGLCPFVAALRPLAAGTKDRPTAIPIRRASEKI
jgi:hypothetical protein